jgi:hypothetical protein
MSYRIIFWENCTDSTKLFKMQKRAIRIIRESKNKDSFKDSFKNLKILPFHSQYILSHLLFVVDNKSMYNLNSDIHDISTRQKTQLPPTCSKYIEKEFTPSASKCSTASLKASKQQLVILSNLKSIETLHTY